MTGIDLIDLIHCKIFWQEAVLEKITYTSAFEWLIKNLAIESQEFIISWQGPKYDFEQCRLTGPVPAEKTYYITCAACKTYIGKDLP